MYSKAEEWVLTPGDLHLWWARLDWPQSVADSFMPLLSPAERERAGRFAFAGDGNRYRVAHGVLRRLLGKYLQVRPAAIGFETFPLGKPVLAEPFSRQGIAFNLSHCRDRVLFGFALNRAVGVDVERVREVPEMKGIVARYFSASEQAALANCAETERRRRFFRCWVLKEALAKAEGVGLGRGSAGLDRVDDGSVSQLLTLRDDRTGICQPGTAFHLQPGPDWAAAAVVAGRDMVVTERCWCFLDKPCQ